MKRFFKFIGWEGFFKRLVIFCGEDGILICVREDFEKRELIKFMLWNINSFLFCLKINWEEVFSFLCCFDLDVIVI